MLETLSAAVQPAKRHKQAQTAKHGSQNAWMLFLHIVPVPLTEIRRQL